MRTMLRIGLIPGSAFCILVDAAGQHAPQVVFDADAQPGADARSRLGAALRRHTSVRQLADNTQEIYIGTQRVARIDNGQVAEQHPLTAFGARFLAENGLPHPDGPLQAKPQANHNECLLRTDLHSHFAGCLSGQDLVELGLGIDAPIPASVLAQAGIFCAHSTPLSVLTDGARARLACALDIPLDRQVTFLDMERLYAMRAPLTRHPALFVPQLWRIAQRAAHCGVQYLELSLSSILEPATLAAAHAVLPLIEEQWGVSIRFLVALSRHDDLQWDLDVLRRTEACLQSRAIVGIDFMGHETNSTRAFLPQLAAAAVLAKQRAGWVVRVHAGESPAFPENVREAVTLLRPWVENHGLELRIGHGLYGLDDATLAEVAALASHLRPHEGSAVFEFNLTSNLALNNIRTTFDVPLRRVMDAGVDVVLGTDGAGLYRTNPQDEAQAARATGLDHAAIEHIAATEQCLLARRRAAQQQLPSWSSFAIPPPTPPLHFTDTFVAHQHAQEHAARAALHTHLQALGVPLLDAHQLRTRLAHRPVLSIAGSWRQSYALLNEADRARLKIFFEELLAGIAPLGGIVLTGGTCEGIEGLLHRCTQNINAQQAEVIGLTSANIPPETLEPHGLSALHVISPTLYSKAAPLYALVQECAGLAVFIGGSVIVADEIQAARNLGVHYCLIDGLAGASAKAAQQDPAHAISLWEPAKAAKYVLGQLTAGPQRERLFHAGANDAVDVVVLRTQPDTAELELLLVRRHDDAPAENGRFALPGGFVLAGESLASAAVREVAEETGLRIAAAHLQAVAVVEGTGRDPRDTQERWVRSHVFVVQIDPKNRQPEALLAGTDASRAFFVPLQARPEYLAFDHDELLSLALQHLAKRPGGSLPSSVDVQ